MRYEVYIPADAADGFDVTLRVEARNWMQALKLGLQRTYSHANPVRNVFCDIKADDLIHVTDLASQRVFKIRRLDEAEVATEPEVAARADDPPMSRPTLLDATAVAPHRFRHPREMPAVDARRAPTEENTLPPDEPARVPRRKTGERLGFTDDTGRFREISRRPVDPAGAYEPMPPQVVEESVIPSTTRMQAITFGRTKTAVLDTVADNTMERVFLDVTRLFDGEHSLESAVSFALDLALDNVPAESGSVLFANEEGTALYFADARGPKSEQLLDGDFSVPLDQGIAGFCTRAGVSLALADVENDPRFYRDVTDALGYTARSLACAPIQHEGRSFGAIELLNHQKPHPFSSDQLNVLTYIGTRLGQFIAELLE